jgi:YgiT-type zinc finger domain-containing protein
MMNRSKPKARCYECGSTMEGRKGEYKYTECGLNSVLLKDILIFRCTNCNAVTPEIPAAGILHRVIGLRILEKKSQLTGSEIKFLRKLCGYSMTEFGEIIGSSQKSVISKWEKDGCGKPTDKLIRMVVITKLVREIAGAPHPILRNVTIEHLLAQVEEAVKLIEGKAKSSERYEISPEELARFETSEQELGDLVVQ